MLKPRQKITNRTKLQLPRMENLPPTAPADSPGCPSCVLRLAQIHTWCSARIARARRTNIHPPPPYEGCSRCRPASRKRPDHHFEFEPHSYARGCALTLAHRRCSHESAIIMPRGTHDSQHERDVLMNVCFQTMFASLIRLATSGHSRCA
jgi:hypothetical protein